MSSEADSTYQGPGAPNDCVVATETPVLNQDLNRSGQDLTAESCQNVSLGTNNVVLQQQISVNLLVKPQPDCGIGHGEKQDDDITTQDGTQPSNFASTIDTSTDDMEETQPARQDTSYEDTDQAVQNKRNSFLENLDKWKKKGGHPLRVLIVGLPGAGKSSFINTFAAALSGFYMEICMIGSGYNECVSPLLTVMEKCGLVEYIDNDDKIKNICKYPIPTLIDVPGLPIQAGLPSPGLIEAIRAMVYGRIKDKTTIVGKGGLLDMTEEDIRKKYPYTQCDKMMEPDIVFVVVSATSPLPDSLILGIMQAVRPADQRYQTSLQVYGVITHVDEVKQESADDYKSKREQFIHLLNMKGREWALLETKNYVNVPPGETVPKIDRVVLSYLTKVTAPGFRTARGNEDEIQKFKDEETKAHEVENRKFQDEEPKVAQNEFSYAKALIIAICILVTFVGMMIDPLIGAICLALSVILCVSLIVMNLVWNI